MSKKKTEIAFSNFKIDETFDIEWNYTSRGFYKIIHEIYKANPKESIIEVSKLPNILNPRFWDVVNGVKREKIKKLKYPNESITDNYFYSLKLRKERLKRTRIVIVNINEMVRTWNTIIGSNEKQKLCELLHRIKTFEDVIQKIKEGKIENTLILSEENDNKNIIYPSLSISNFFILETVRYEGAGNLKRFSYRPNSTIFKTWFDTTWSEIYQRNHSIIPKYIHKPNDIPKHKDLVKKHNLINLRKLSGHCMKILNVIKEKNDVQLNKVIKAFSNNNNGAIKLVTV